jgi:hypothetical protein
LHVTRPLFPSIVTDGGVHAPSGTEYRRFFELELHHHEPSKTVPIASLKKAAWHVPSGFELIIISQLKIAEFRSVW